MSTICWSGLSSGCDWMIIKAIHHSCWSNVITGDTWWHLACSAMYSSVDWTHVGSLGVKSTTGRNIAELFPGCGSWEWSSCMQPDHRGLGLGEWQDTRHSISILLFTLSLLNGPSLVYIILPWMCLGSFCVTSFTCPIFLRSPKVTLRLSMILDFLTAGVNVAIWPITWIVPLSSMVQLPWSMLSAMYWQKVPAASLIISTPCVAAALLL